MLSRVFCLAALLLLCILPGKSPAAEPEAPGPAVDVGAIMTEDIDSPATSAMPEQDEPPAYLLSPKPKRAAPLAVYRASISGVTETAVISGQKGLYTLKYTGVGEGSTCEFEATAQAAANLAPILRGGGDALITFYDKKGLVRLPLLARFTAPGHLSFVNPAKEWNEFYCRSGGRIMHLGIPLQKR